jgi:hypothetical protein
MGPPLPNNTLDQPLPSPLAPHLHTLVSFQHQCHSLCQQLFYQLATALQTPQEWFTSRHDQSQGPSGTVFRMLYYPANDDIDGTDLRAGAHSDFGSLTLLFQLPGQPGLEVKTPEGHWASVPVDPSNNAASGKALPILVNIGDLLEDVRALSYPLSHNSNSNSIQKETTHLYTLTSPSNAVDRRPPQIHPSPRHLPSNTNKIARPLLARVLLPPARRRFTRTRAQRSRARACSRRQNKRTQDSGWQSRDDGEGPFNGTLGRDVFSWEVEGLEVTLYLCKSRVRNYGETNQGMTASLENSASLHDNLTRSPPGGYFDLTRVLLASRSSTVTLAAISQKFAQKKIQSSAFATSTVAQTILHSPVWRENNSPLVYVQVENSTVAGHSFISEEGKEP